MGLIRNIGKVQGDGLGMLRSGRPDGPQLKTAEDMAGIRKAGHLVSAALRLARGMALPGTKLEDIDRAVENFFRDHGAEPLFKGYPGKVPYPGSTCLSVNEQVVHGLPGPRLLAEGDLLKVDTACRLDGWCADAAITVGIGAISSAKDRLCQVAWEVLDLAIRETAAQLKKRGNWSDVASKMQLRAESAGYRMVTQYVGHGIGRAMHEPPQVPNYVDRQTRRSDFRLEPGLVLAVEPMLNMGESATKVLRDHWTVVTRDGLSSAHVEHTLGLTEQGVWVLTADDKEERIVSV